MYGHSCKIPSIYFERGRGISLANSLMTIMLCRNAKASQEGLDGGGGLVFTIH